MNLNRMKSCFRRYHMRSGVKTDFKGTVHLLTCDIDTCHCYEIIKDCLSHLLLLCYGIFICVFYME